jgi:hypothetical protein
MARRRYDTAGLVSDLRRERRQAMVLTVVGLVILVALVYAFVKLRTPSVPDIPKPGDPGAAVTAPTPRPPPPPPAPAPTPAPEPEKPKAPEPAHLTIKLAKAGPISVDGVVVVKKGREHEATLTPGPHKVSTRVGRKIVEVPFEAQAGKRYKLELDVKKKKKPVVEALP